MPSVLLKSTGQSRVSKMPSDIADNLLARTKTSSALHDADSKPGELVLGLDEYLRRYTSEDNQSF